MIGVKIESGIVVFKNCSTQEIKTTFENLYGINFTTNNDFYLYHLHEKKFQKLNEAGKFMDVDNIRRIHLIRDDGKHVQYYVNDDEDISPTTFPEKKSPLSHEDGSFNPLLPWVTKRFNTIK